MYAYHKGNKYGNRKVTIFGITFDSKHEAQRYLELVSMQRAGLISDLRIQVPYEVIPPIKDDISGRTIQRGTTYVADFVYWDGHDYIVEDAKGVRTDAYKLKKKLMLWRHGILIREV